jgi:hypothetical protein
LFCLIIGLIRNSTRSGCQPFPSLTRMQD